MSQPRKITNYFRRPDFALTAQKTRSEHTGEDPQPDVLSSPSTELSQLNVTPETHSTQLRQSLLLSTGNPADNDPARQESIRSVETITSFGCSQRIMKKGKEVVISSDGEESDSIGSFESPEDLFREFTTPKIRITDESQMDYDSPPPGITLRARKPPKARSVPQRASAPPVYKNSLENLVMQAVSENETEAGIARLRASLKVETALENGSDSANTTNLHEGVLASALDDGSDETMGLQRLLDAVRRTEAFDLAKSWFFFDLQNPLPPPPEFPRDCICPGTYLAVLREPDSRERAFHSGIVDFALSKDLLPDELVKWIFHSIPSEPRNSLRHAYCRAIKRMTAERMRSLILPDDIDTIFRRLGARPAALALSETIVPDTKPQGDTSQVKSQHNTALISILGIFRDAADHFSEDTRHRILSVLLRLPLDVSLTRDSILCSELEKTITAVLEDVTDDAADEVATGICQTAYSTLKHAELQSHLLQHIVPTNDWIATLRRRLAFIFLTDDPLALVGSKDRRTEAHRITNILKNPRFNVKRYKRKGQPEYDYGELRATVTFLNIVIDSGWSETVFHDKSAEEEFNSEIDVLADRVKKIFTAIEDSGASHLKRTLAKEALESLHYRIVYSVRSKPPPKKVLFGQYEPERKTQNLLQYLKKEKVLILSDKPGS